MVLIIHIYPLNIDSKASPFVTPCGGFFSRLKNTIPYMDKLCVSCLHIMLPMEAHINLDTNSIADDPDHHLKSCMHNNFDLYWINTK